MAYFIAWLKSSKDMHPVQVAGEAHYRLVTIHPFSDWNGRTTRLLMNLILIVAGYLLAIIRLQERLTYITFLETAQLGGSKEAYEKIIFNAVNRSLDIYLKAANGVNSSDVYCYDFKSWVDDSITSRRVRSVKIEQRSVY